MPAAPHWALKASAGQDSLPAADNTVSGEAEIPLPRGHPLLFSGIGKAFPVLFLCPAENSQ